jgi:hypothetical protein
LILPDEFRSRYIVSRKIMKTSALTLTLGFCLVSSFAPAKDKGEDQVEIKCLIPEDKITAISEKLRLACKDPLIRVVCFFDTDSLDLFHHTPKVILRSRFDPSNEPETLVKIRGKMLKEDGVKCESDEVLGKPPIESCSVTNKKQKRAEIEHANAGQDVKKIFSMKQKSFAEGVSGKIEWAKLQPYGPIPGIQVWKDIKVPAVSGVSETGPPLTVERWELPARPGQAAKVLFEVSTKVPLSQDKKTSKWMTDLLDLSVSDGEESETKTKLVLEHFAGHSP